MTCTPKVIFSLCHETHRQMTWYWCPYLKSICLSMRLAVATRGSLPVERPCSSRLEDMIWVVISVSAAVPAPQQLQKQKQKVASLHVFTHFTTITMNNTPTSHLRLCYLGPYSLQSKVSNEPISIMWPCKQSASEWKTQMNDTKSAHATANI